MPDTTPCSEIRNKMLLVYSVGRDDSQHHIVGRFDETTSEGELAPNVALMNAYHILSEDPEVDLVSWRVREECHILTRCKT